MLYQEGACSLLPLPSCSSSVSSIFLCHRCASLPPFPLQYRVGTQAELKTHSNCHSLSRLFHDKLERNSGLVHVLCQVLNPRIRRVWHTFEGDKKRMVDTVKSPQRTHTKPYRRHGIQTTPNQTVFSTHKQTAQPIGLGKPYQPRKRQRHHQSHKPA